MSPAIEHITEDAWLLAAYKRAEIHCRKSFERARFVYQLPSELKRMQDEIRSNSYAFGPYTTKIVVDPKRRVIHKAPFRDRVVHQAIYAYLEEGFDRRMIFHSYACRKNKGTSAAATQICKWTSRFDYAIKLDMAKYFASIDHERLLQKLRPRISDAVLYDFIEKLIHSFSPGIPIGNLTSQLFANWYLNAADHFIKRELKVKYYARYMDDLILFSNSKPELWAWAKEIKQYVEERELLSIPGRKTVSVSTKRGGVPFLGYWFFKDKMPRLQQRTLIGQKKRLRKLKEGVWSEDEYLASSAGWWGHASYALNPKLARDIGVDDLAKRFSKNRFV